MLSPGIICWSGPAFIAPASTVINTLSITKQLPMLDLTLYSVEVVGVAIGLLHREQLKPVEGDHSTLPLLVADNWADPPGQT
jgi:hypothetical protein